MDFAFYGVVCQGTLLRNSAKIKYMAKIKIIHRQETMEFECDPGENILTQGLSLGFKLPFACMMGTCCTCHGRIIKGKVSMDIRPCLSDDEIKEGQVLTCQAFPDSDEVEIILD